MRFGDWRGVAFAVALGTLALGLATPASADLGDLLLHRTIPRDAAAVDLTTGQPMMAPPIPYGEYAKDYAGSIHNCLGTVAGVLHGGCGLCGGAGCSSCMGGGLFHGLGHGDPCASCGGAGCGHCKGSGLFHHGKNYCGACGGAGCGRCKGAGLFHGKGRGCGNCGGSGCGLCLASGQAGPVATAQSYVLPSGQACGGCHGKGCGLCGGKGFLGGLGHGKRGCGNCGGMGCGLCGGGRGLLHGCGHGGDPGCSHCGGVGCGLCHGGKGIPGLGLVSGLLHHNKIQYFVGPGGPVPLTPGYVPYVVTTRSPRDFFAFPPFSNLDP